MDVASVPAVPSGIVAYDDALYVSAHPLGTRDEPFGPPNAPRGIYRVRLGRGAKLRGDELLTVGAAPRILAVDGEFTWTMDLLLRRAPRDGGERETLPFSMPHWLALSGDDVFVSDLAGIFIVDRRADLQDGLDSARPRLFAKDGVSRRVVVDGDDIFYDAFVYPHPEKGCRIMRRTRSGSGTARVLAEIDRETIDLGVMRDHVIVGTKLGPLLRIPRDGGRPEVIGDSASGGWFMIGPGSIAWFTKDERELVVWRGPNDRSRIALPAERRPSRVALLLGHRVALYGSAEPDARGRFPIVALPIVS